MGGEKGKLTPKQQRFCEEYLIDLNATQAAVRAGYSPKTAREIGNENLTKPIISEFLIQKQKERSERVQVTADEILEHLNILRKANIAEYVEYVAVTSVNDAGVEETKNVLQFKPFDQLTEKQLMCIESIKDTKYGVELKLHGKDWTIEKINKHIGFYEADNDQRSPEQPIVNISYNGKGLNLGS